MLVDLTVVTLFTPGTIQRKCHWCIMFVQRPRATWSQDCELLPQKANTSPQRLSFIVSLFRSHKSTRFSHGILDAFYSDPDVCFALFLRLTTVLIPATTIHQSASTKGYEILRFLELDSLVVKYCLICKPLYRRVPPTFYCPHSSFVKFHGL